MIYKSKERAVEVAAMLNREMPGYAPTKAYRVAAGWTVICSWVPLSLGQFGILEFAEFAEQVN